MGMSLELLSFWCHCLLALRLVSGNAAEWDREGVWFTSRSKMNMHCCYHVIRRDFLAFRVSSVVHHPSSPIRISYHLAPPIILPSHHDIHPHPHHHHTIILDLRIDQASTSRTPIRILGIVKGSFSRFHVGDLAMRVASGFLSRVSLCFVLWNPLRSLVRVSFAYRLLYPLPLRNHQHHLVSRPTVHVASHLRSLSSQPPTNEPTGPHPLRTRKSS